MTIVLQSAVYLESFECDFFPPPRPSLQDNDNRVRDAAHRALKSVVEVVKGSLGDHLRSVIGCWVSGMGDPHGPAASTAVVAFFAAFPQQQKQVEAYQYCFKAILNVRMYEA